jgi:hypothetical protein
VVAFERLRSAVGEVLGHLMMFDAGLRTEEMVFVNDRFAPRRDEAFALLANITHGSLQRAF